MSEDEATGRAEKWQQTLSPKMPVRSHRMRFKGIYLKTPTPTSKRQK